MFNIISFYFSAKSLLIRLRNSKISFFSFFDKDCVISTKAVVNRFCSLRSTSIDDYTYIGPNSSITNAIIGKFCSIADDVKIGLPVHPIKNISTSPIFFSPNNGTRYRWIDKKVFDDYPQQTIIGNDVWIGTNVSIMGGVQIGDGAIIGAHSLVTKDVEPYSIVGGVPAKLIKTRFDFDILDVLQKTRWWDLDEDTLKNNINLFSKPLDSEIYENLINISNANRK